MTIQKILIAAVVITCLVLIAVAPQWRIAAAVPLLLSAAALVRALRSS